MIRPLASGLLLGALLCSGPAAAQTPPSTLPQGSPAARLAALEALYPPWQRGENNDAPRRGLEFTVPPADVLADFHGSLDDPALVLYASGNYFFAMAPLVQAFGAAHPEYRGRLYYETLPPGLLLKQMEAGGTVTSGNMTWTVKPDVYMAEQRASEALVRQGRLAGEVVPFVTNDLTIMVPAGNPAGVKGLQDLGRPDIALVMPNPAWEGVAQQIRASLAKAGGEALASAVYDAKVKDGTTILTRIHHRQTPLFLMQGLGQAGVTWTSEALFQEQAGHPISHVAIPPEQNTRAVYSAAMVAGAPHPEAARAWLGFLRSEAALRIFERYGFRRHADAAR
ncbi:substrate-binding domain-containing protein [Roseicella aquatilis]|uniref:ABC transporter substrate-binding protein n=1 Tax=Roseicella aquatilis TaxID=2527868 RepID=A0A4R4D5Q2_9PROT|nr:substrate-binding domain-containing protein [Roseicella aquatilis]TCZ52765.1 ABC transporter substrate-binding protein [Roseicella aquatilis]